MDTLRFEVEQAFQLTGRGAALVTSTDLSMLKPGTPYRLRYRDTGGRERVATAFLEWFLRRQPVLVERAALMACGASSGDFPSGTIVEVSVDRG